MRAALLAAGLLLAISCGGSSELPTAAGPVPAPRAIVLASGPYVLTMTMSTSGTATCQNGFCTSISLCVNNPSPMTAAVNVTVERAGEVATVRAEGGASLLLTLTVAPTFVSGTIAGSARDSQGGVTPDRMAGLALRDSTSDDDLPQLWLPLRTTPAQWSAAPAIRAARVDPMVAVRQE